MHLRGFVKFRNRPPVSEGSDRLNAVPRSVKVLNGPVYPMRSLKHSSDETSEMFQVMVTMNQWS